MMQTTLKYRGIARALTEQMNSLVQGQEIVRVELNPSYDPASERWIYNPCFYLTNGMVLSFTVQPVDMYKQGIRPVLRKEGEQDAAKQEEGIRTISY
jgi:hypothetical protein